LIPFFPMENEAKFIMEDKKIRDYSHEYKLRQARTKRMYADIDRSKAEELQSLLKERGITYSAWLFEQINKELDKTL
jgi:putative AlgH/UPF0301 family transcriptional regulator